MPEFTGQRLTYSGVDSAAWQALPPLITNLETLSGETYYVIVVESTGNGALATRDYTDRLYEHWVQQAASRSIAFDTQRMVLVVLGIQNRQLSVKVGQKLLHEFGMNASTIDQQLVQPYFIPFAKAGNYPEGVEALIRQINIRISAHVQPAVPEATSHQLPEVAVLRSEPITSKPPSQLSTRTETRTEHPQQPSDSGLRLTSPIVMAGTAIALGMLTLFVLRWLHVRVRRPLDARKQTFRQQVVQLSDDIDTLRERHRTLPFTDKDYKEPMIGETLALYNGIQISLESLRQRWLELMDVWDKVDSLEKNESYFGRSALREATKLLETVPVSDVEKTLNEQCLLALDRLEDAHELVQRLDKSLDDSLQRIQSQLTNLQNVKLATEPYQASLENVSEMRLHAAKISLPDPIGSQTIQNAAIDLLRAAGVLTERILQHRRGIDELSGKLKKVSDLLASLRSDGMKFCEEDSDPSPMFPTIQHHCDECLKLLNLGDAETAAEHLRQGFELSEQSQSAIQRQVDSMEFCRQEIPIRASEQQQLERLSKLLDPVMLALQSEFSPESWNSVANLQSIASEAVSHARSVLSEATISGSDNVQHYQAAAATLRQLKQLQSDTTLQISTGDQRLQQLRQMRTEATEELNQLQQYRNRISTLLQSSSADRAAPNRKFQETETSLQRLIQIIALSRANWPQITESLSSIRHDFATAEQMAQEDIRLAEQASQEIMHAQRELRQAESFYRSGYKADVAAMRPQLLSAQQALNNQEYERAIDLASDVISKSRHEVRQAEYAADATEQRRALERRDRERSLGAGLGMMATGLSNATTAHHHSSDSTTFSMPDTSSHSSDTSTSSSSWSSETSQSSW